MIVFPLIVAVPWLGEPTTLMLSGCTPPVSLASTGIEASVPCEVVALSSTAISTGGATPVREAVSVPPGGGSPGGGGGNPLGDQVTLKVLE